MGVMVVMVVSESTRVLAAMLKSGGSMPVQSLAVTMELAATQITMRERHR